MAAAFFNAVADPAKAHALSAGTQPAMRVNPTVADGLHGAVVKARKPATARRVLPLVATAGAGCC